MMLTRRLACPSCSVKLRVAHTLPVGKMIKCPKCGEGFPVPAGNGDSASPKAAAARPRKTAPAPEDYEVLDDDVEEQPRRRKVPGTELSPPEDYEVLDDEVEEPPVPRKLRKKPKKAAGGPVLLWGLVIGGAVLLVGVAVTLAIVLWPSEKKSASVSSSAASGPGPSAGSANSGATSPNSDPLAAGRKLFDANCARCHTVGGSGSSSGEGGGKMGGRGRGPDLSKVGADRSHTIDWLMAHIRNPKAHNPDSRMPAFEGKLKDEELRALAVYLASLK